MASTRLLAAGGEAYFYLIQVARQAGALRLKERFLARPTFIKRSPAQVRRQGAQRGYLAGGKKSLGDFIEGKIRVDKLDVDTDFTRTSYSE